MKDLHHDDRRHLDQHVKPFLDDLTKLMQKHQLDHLDMNLKFGSRQNVGCLGTWFSDGKGGQCWKCLGDMSPCP